MAALSKWLLEDIDAQEILNTDKGAASAMVGDTDTIYYVYGNYSAYENYGDYGDYYGDYYGNYSNSISIITNPTSQTIYLGESVTFSITTSTTPDSYQWYVADSSSGSGTSISGATAASYTFTPTISDNGKYYYCTVNRGGNKKTSSRAQLTVNEPVIKSYKICSYVNGGLTAFYKTYPTSTITSWVIADTNIATVSSTGVVTGVNVGNTTLTITAASGAICTVDVTIYGTKLEAVLANTSTAIKAKNNIESNLYPNQFANALESSQIVSKSYNSMDELFSDIALIVRNITGITSTMFPEEFYHNILNSIE